MKNKGATFIALNEFVSEPEFVVDSNTSFVKFGKDNKLPEQLITYYRTVGLHRAIVDKKKKLIIGEGLNIKATEDKKTKKTVEFLNNINKFENADSLFEKIALDLALFSGVYLQVIWEKGGKRIKEVYHMPFEQMRSGKKNEYGFVDNFYYNTSEEKHEKWANYTDINNKYIHTFPTFSTKSNKNKAQILFIHEYEPGYNYYSLPDYIGAIKDLNTMQSITDFNNANIHNNMQPGLTIMFNGPEPSKDQKDDIVKNIKKKYSNTTNAGRPMIFWLEQDQKLTLEQPEASDISEMYKILSDDTKENIIVSHQITRAVAGLLSPGSLGSTKEMLEGIEIIRSNYIKPIQEFFLSRFNVIMNINGMEEIELTSPSPNLMKYSIKDLSEILTNNEIREFLGKDSIFNQTKVEDIEEEVTDETVVEEQK